MNFLKFISKILNKIGLHLIHFSKVVINYKKTTYQTNLEKWWVDQGDKTLRLDYDLSDASIVLDLGGYEGQWSSDIFSRYGCSIYIFEPVPEFFYLISERFIRNKKIEVFNFGLSDQNKTEIISLNKESSSVYKRNGKLIPITLVNFAQFFCEHELESIDLMKINIEGGEYDLLDALISSKWIEKVINLQVQFHNFFPEAENRMEKIQDQLSITHTLTYQYPFIWENWLLRIR